MSSDDILVSFEDELDLTQDLLFSEADGSNVVVELMNFSQYYHEDIYWNLDEIDDPAYSPRHTRPIHWKELLESMSTQGGRYGLGLDMMRVLIAGLNSDALSA